MKIYRNTYYLNVSEGSGTSSSEDWQDKPSSWSDIRKDCPTDSIALYVGCREEYDYTLFDNLGFTATCTGGYNVFIDGVQYGTTYASGAQCDITWSTSGIATGDDITTPETLKAHKIWITPATEGAEITAFHCSRVAASGDEGQGVLWAHFNLSNEIDLTNGFSNYGVLRNTLFFALTAKNNIIKASGIAGLLGEGADRIILATNTSYVPVYDLNNNTIGGGGAFNVLTTATMQQVILKNGTINFTDQMFANATNLKKVKTINLSFSGNRNDMFKNCQSLEELPKGLVWNNTTQASDFLTNAKNLKDTVLDTSSATNLTKIGCYGDSYNFMAGFKGLRVSDQAPFTGTTPQINVSYTGMDRAALVQLFNDLPTVNEGQIINITGCAGSDSLTAEDILIATNKGWSVSGGPAYNTFATYSGASVDDTVKLNDGMATSDYDWSAYPSDTAVTGDYTKTDTVTKVSEGVIGIADEPSQDNKTVTITTDENATIEIIDNTTVQTTTIISDQDATIETSADVTSDNNNVAITDGSYHLFNITVPSSLTSIMQNGGQQFNVTYCPYLFKHNTGVGLLLKNGNNVYYRNSWVMNKSYDLHYQQINFSYPSGATVTCKVNNVTTDLTPYVYAGDIVSWTCDNAGVVTTGTYTVKYNSVDGNIQTITIS